MDAPFAFPSPSKARASVAAVWTGEAFSVGGKSCRVLSYGVGQSGWDENLTRLHEESAGKDHFMDVASRRHAIEEIRRSITHTPSIIIEFGCSSGFLLRELVERLPEHVIIGSDYTLGTLQTLASEVPRVPLLHFDLTCCPLLDGFADIAILLNVLEHIEDDEAAVAQVFRVLRPGGTAVIEVPAQSSLLDVYDRVLMHFRRYDMPQLIELLRRTGFVIERRSHLGFFLFSPFYLSKRLNQMRYRARQDIDEQALVTRMITNTARSGPLMRYLMTAEHWLRRRIYLPFGIRCLVTCRKPAR
jgi:SAM-dependent methyltransferase